MENFHKIVFWFENTRDETSLASRLNGQLIGVANALKSDFLDPGDVMFISSKLSSRGPDLWE